MTTVAVEPKKVVLRVEVSFERLRGRVDDLYINGQYLTRGDSRDIREMCRVLGKVLRSAGVEIEERHVY